MLGVEKTLLNDLYSVELRIPFAHGLRSSQDISVSTRGNNDLTDTEFGNLSMAVKRLVCRNRCSTVSVGLGTVLPTGDDGVVSDTARPVVKFENDSIHLQPFLGVYHAPRPRLFTQFFTQLDFDTSGNKVTGFGTTSELRDQTLLFLDYSVGYWAYRCHNRCYFRSLAPMLELHYSTTLEDQDYGSFTGSSVFVEDSRRDSLNITGGLYIELGPMSSLKIAAVAPLRKRDSDRMFDSEFGIQFARRYGLPLT